MDPCHATLPGPTTNRSNGSSIPSIFQLNAGYFLKELASEFDKNRIYKLLGEHSRADANGVPQV